MMTRYLALDIETANLDMESEGLQFGNPDGWQTSCVCLYDFWIDEGVENGVPIYYVEDPEKVVSVDDNLKYYNLRGLSELSSDLERFFKQGYTLVSKNGLGFDMPILMKSFEKGGADCYDILRKYELDKRHIDICYLLRQQYGFRFSLQNLVKGLYGDSDSKTMSASKAPELWAEKEYRLVLDYCMHDCVLTGKVFVEAPLRSFTATGRKNGRSQTMIISPSWT